MGTKLNPWSKRLPEDQGLRSPSFCAFLLYESIRAYEKETDGLSMPYSLIFLILPILLHKKTREQLPRQKATTMFLWIVAKPGVTINFDVRVKNTNPYTREALLYLLSTKSIELNGSGIQHIPKQLRTSTKLKGASDDYKLCTQKAAFLGKWFARTKDAATIFMLWGVRP